MCDESNGEIKYFIINVVEDERLFLFDNQTFEGLSNLYKRSFYKMTKNVFVTDKNDDIDINQVG